MCIATVVERSRTSVRPPGRLQRARQRAPAALAHAEAHQPHRLVLAAAAGAGDAGDADPDVGFEGGSTAPAASACGHRHRHRAVLGDQFRRHPGQRALGRVGVGHQPPGHVRRRARAFGQPRGHQPAGARLGHGDRPRRRPAQQRRHLLVDRGAVVGEQRVAVAGAHLAGQPLVDVRGRRLVAGDHLQLAAAQAGGDLQAIELHARFLGRPQCRGQLGLGDPEHAQHPLAVDRGPGRGLAEGLGAAPRPPTSAAARAAGRAARPPSGRRRPPPAPPGPARCPPAPARSRPRGITACLRLEARTASSSSWGQRCQQRAQDRGDALLQRLVEHHLAPAERAHHLGGQVVGRGAQPPAGDDQVHALGGHEAQRRRHLLAAITHDRVVDEVDRPGRAGARTATARCGPIPGR